MQLTTVVETTESQVQEAFEALNYNQQLVQFADSKAGNLIVINSLFVAAVHGGTSALQTVYVLLSSLAVLACLKAIGSRTHGVASDRKDLIFFHDILSRGTAVRYVRDFREATNAQRFECALRRTYVLAEIARDKFSVCNVAQRLTGAAAIGWMLAHI
jgi:hypothetical protein